jgi:hypothetical protein
MAVIRTQTWGLGGVNTDLPFDNLVEVSDYDEETGQSTVYLPPFDNVPPVASHHEAPSSGDDNGRPRKGK